MSLYILHPQTVTTPSYSTSLTKTRNASSTPILPRYCTARPIVLDRQVSSLRAIPVQNVQRAEKSTTALQQPIEELLGLNVPGEQPIRKRECLNHLTAEEKQNRRKLKNRVAAQTARDRKKYRASKLEEAVRTLILENRKLREENKCLKKTCEELKSQNVELQELLNKNEEREESCSETEVSSSNNMPSSSFGSAESIRGPQQREQAMMRSHEMQEIIGEICATDGTDSTLQSVDGTTLEFERFCSEILGEIDDPLATSDSTETKSPKSCNTRRVDCTTPDIIIAPEYLKPDPEPQTSSPTSLNVSIENVMDYTELSSLTNSDMENDHSVQYDQLSDYSSSVSNPSKSPKVSRHISSSPSSFTFLSSMKEENNDTSSPLISDNDPMFCIPHKWDVDDDYI